MTAGQPFTSLSDASATGPGARHDLGSVRLNHTMNVTVGGTAPTELTVDLEGSHDGATWWSMGSVSDVAGGQVTAQSVVRFVRASITTLTGGPPTVTATLGSA